MAGSVILCTGLILGLRAHKVQVVASARSVRKSSGFEVDLLHGWLSFIPVNNLFCGSMVLYVMVGNVPNFPYCCWCMVCL